MPEPTIIEKLRVAQSNYVQQLLDLSDPAKRKPSYSVGGRSISWTEYQRWLLDAIKQLEQQIAELDSDGYLVTAVP